MTPRHWSERLSAREWGLVATAFALAFDQGSKIALLYGFNFHAMRPGQAIRVLPFFNLVMMWNPGISYGLFPAHNLWGSLALGLFSAIAIVALGWWMWRSERRLLASGLGLVVGGAIGNLIDRLIYGAVADFFHFHAFGYDWYVFNVADAAITFGVIALLYDALLRPDAN
ncbi:MAG TPA: signal peptidase II [Rhizomicrobium sp.]|jgi:signal peptidase II|nr:signal peptidase II [Rhizomicrobium sp.]